MNNLNLENFRQVHFIGVGGISMYLLALYCKDYGLKVSGSDARKTKYTDICKDRGIKVYIKHRRKNIDCADLVVYTNAVGENNIELVEARNRGIKVLERAEFLSIVLKNFKCVIGISGSHGKTTTSAMLYHIMRECGMRVSCHIGADVLGSRLNPFDEYLVLECCEYNKSFLNFKCDKGVVLNIDNDHLDCYQNMYNLKNAFKMFLSNCKDKFIFENETTSFIKTRATKISKPNIIAPNKFEYKDYKYILNNAYGNHNLKNAAAAVEVALSLGLSPFKIKRALKNFMPAGRRCQVLGKVKGADVITDYAHHPTEIESLYNSLNLKYDNIYFVFQPHTFSRTKILINDFVRVLGAVEKPVIIKQYPARENKRKGYSSKQLCEYLDKATYIKNYSHVKKFVKNQEFKKNACLVFVGAGDINLLAEKLVRHLGIKS